MIFGNVEHSEYRLLHNWELAPDLPAPHDLTAWEPGVHPIRGDDGFVRISDHITKPEEEAVYEAHDQFPDIQRIVHGAEVIRCAFRSDTDGITQAHPKRNVPFF